MPFEDTYSPNIHRINQAIRHRAIYPGGDLPKEPAPILTKWQNPPEKLVADASESLERLIATAAVKKGKIADSIAFRFC